MKIKNSLVKLILAGLSATAITSWFQLYSTQTYAMENNKNIIKTTYIKTRNNLFTNFLEYINNLFSEFKNSDENTHIVALKPNEKDYKCKVEYPIKEELQNIQQVLKNPLFEVSQDTIYQNLDIFCEIPNVMKCLQPIFPKNEVIPKGDIPPKDLPNIFTFQRSLNNTLNAAINLIEILQQKGGFYILKKSEKPEEKTKLVNFDIINYINSLIDTIYYKKFFETSKYKPYFLPCKNLEELPDNHWAKKTFSKSQTIKSEIENYSFTQNLADALINLIETILQRFNSKINSNTIKSIYNSYKAFRDAFDFYFKNLIDGIYNIFKYNVLTDPYLKNPLKDEIKNLLNTEKYYLKIKNQILGEIITYLTDDELINADNFLENLCYALSSNFYKNLNLYIGNSSFLIEKIYQTYFSTSKAIPKIIRKIIKKFAHKNEEKVICLPDPAVICEMKAKIKQKCLSNSINASNLGTALNSLAEDIIKNYQNYQPKFEIVEHVPVKSTDKNALNHNDYNDNGEEKIKQKFLPTTTAQPETKIDFSANTEKKLPLTNTPLNEKVKLNVINNNTYKNKATIKELNTNVFNNNNIDYLLANEKAPHLAKIKTKNQKCNKSVPKKSAKTLALKLQLKNSTAKNKTDNFNLKYGSVEDIITRKKTPIIEKIDNINENLNKSASTDLPQNIKKDFSKTNSSFYEIIFKKTPDKINTSNKNDENQNSGDDNNLDNAFIKENSLDLNHDNNTSFNFSTQNENLNKSALDKNMEKLQPDNSEPIESFEKLTLKLPPENSKIDDDNNFYKNLQLANSSISKKSDDDDFNKTINQIYNSEDDATKTKEFYDKQLDEIWD